MTDAFPTEVWRLLWKSASRKDWGALSSSCRLFRDICQPFMFRQLVFFTPCWEEICPTKPEGIISDMQRTLDKLRFFASNPRISQMVDSVALLLGLEDSEHVSGFIRLHPNMAQFTSSIGVYTNLSELDISGFHLTSDFCRTLATLPKFTALELDECIINCPEPFDGLALEHFLCQVEGNSDRGCSLVSGSRLQDLILRDPIPAKAWLTGFVSSGPLPHLVYLNLHLNHEAKDIFFRFLDCCPQLKCIKLQAPPSFADITLPDTTSPGLLSFKGPIDIAGSFAGGRPVRGFILDPSGSGSLESFGQLVDETVLQKTLLQIATANATLINLTMPCISLDSSPLCLIAKTFGKLKQLEFFLRNPDDLEEEDEHFEDPGNDWETVDGLSDGSVDEVLEIDGDTVEYTLKNVGRDDSNEHEHCDECMSDCSVGESVTNDDSEFAVNEGTYNDIKLKSFKDFVRCLADDLIPLPRNLQVLSIHLFPNLSLSRAREKPMSDADISSVVTKLGIRYLRLKKVVVESKERVWRRKGGVWEPPRQRPINPFQVLKQFPLA
ncbi:F-box domain-containing protein [Favolaschia claudopus]|uniref:F-box domain-containing protein n=1 Tax=Favolaschia claudopus TaxID=2862362 RepID=A0AAW0DT04_9AGAR